MTGTGLPLEGVRVVEMTHMVMGPSCGMILAQLGAEVIKVEPPAGDKTRSLGGMGTSFFPLFNRGKRSVVLDFSKAEDRETMQRLLAAPFGDTVQGTVDDPFRHRLLALVHQAVHELSKH